MLSNEVHIGVVIPNHNYGRWIQNALQSVVDEPYSNKRIAVVDDGSTDNSWPLLCKILNLPDIVPHKPLEGKFENVPVTAYRYTQAGGPSRARNTGIKMLWQDTDLYAFLDSDDEYKPGKLTW
jgi:glycosyltransferase involved in cell wall biosynthesis